VRIPALPVALLIAAVALSACTPSTERVSTAPAGDRPGSPLPTPPVPEPSGPQVASVAPPLPPTPAPIVVPENALYVCVTDVNGASRQTVIEFEPKVRALCGRHPELGPCQYERDVCRRGGGRVYAAQGREITLQTEAEYDRKVWRVRLQSN